MTIGLAVVAFVLPAFELPLLTNPFHAPKVISASVKKKLLLPATADKSSCNHSALNATAQVPTSKS